MSIFKGTLVTLLALTVVMIAVGSLTSSATAQSPRTPQPIPDGDRRSITTSGLVVVTTGETFNTDGVQIPPCPNGTVFMATALQATPVPFTPSNTLSNLAKWRVSAQVNQLGPFGSFSPYLTVVADGPAHASTSMPGGQPLHTDEDANVTAALLDGPALGTTSFVVHVTGYCGVPFVHPA